MKSLIALSYCLALLSCNRGQRDIAEKKQALTQASDKRVENVIALLKADCDSNLLKETYKRVQQLQQSK